MAIVHRFTRKNDPKDIREFTAYGQNSYKLRFKSTDCWELGNASIDIFYILGVWRASVSYAESQYEEADGPDMRIDPNDLQPTSMQDWVYASIPKVKYAKKDNICKCPIILLMRRGCDCGGK